MMPSDRRSAKETSSAGSSDGSRACRTLPPPEWLAPNAQDAPPGVLDVQPLARRTGPRAEEAWRRARVVEARAGGDPAAIREACARLARWLASRDRDLDEATELAAAALQIGQDIELRRELSSWLESLGEPARAAAALKPIASLPSVESGEAAYVLVKTGLLRARAGGAPEAAAAFEAALAIDAVDPVPAELLGALSGWGSDGLCADAAVEAYVEAARRRAAHKQDDAELEDLWRALAAAPASEVAGSALRLALEKRGRIAAADEVRRQLEGAGAAAPIGDDVAAHVDPTSARCAAELADAAAAQPAAADFRSRSEDADARVAAGGRAAASLERAIGMIGPRPGWCAALALLLDTCGETELAVGWTQRYLALCPCDRRQTGLLFDRLVRAADPSRLRDGLSWLLAQPQPMAWATAIFAAALSELGRLDAERAAVVARRALEVFGPKSEVLREAMLEIASEASDDRFALAILERWLSCGAEGSDRSGLFVRLAELRERLGDDEGVARTVARAVREGVRTQEIDRRIEAADGQESTPDALLWRLRAIADLRASQANPGAASAAWRDLGAALWDLADDRAGALAAWHVAARTVPSGHETLARDLVAFAGAASAHEYFTRLVAAESDGVLAARIAAAAADAALQAGEPALAFDLAARGLERNPRSAGSLEAAEGAVRQTGEAAALSGLYEVVASRAFGRFGRRAAHYRATRFFERAGDPTLALRHAASAFRAVPSEGSTFQFLARTAERSGDRMQAIQAIEEVAEEEPRPSERAAWLLRAASIAGEGEDGARRKIDVLLRATVVSPRVETIARLRTAAREMLRLRPEERDGLELRIGRAMRTASGRVDGPEGARVAIAFATMMLDIFADPGAALGSLQRAFACDANVGGFDELLGHALELGQAAGMREVASAVLAAADRPQANVGVSALRLIAAMATAAGDDVLRARGAIAAALRAPDDDALIVAADHAAARVSSPEMVHLLASRIGSGRRAEALVAVARAHVAQGAYAEAAALFERAAELVDQGARAELEQELRATWKAAGRGSEIEARAHQAALAKSSPSARAEGWMEVAELREARADWAGAVQALLEACRLDPEPLARWSALERVAEMAGDDAARITALEQIETHVSQDGRTTVLKRLALVHEHRGDLGAAERTWRRVLADDPDDEEADQAIASIIVARNGYDELVDHLAHRAERLAASPIKGETLRAVRLRRAAILEQRLARTEDACNELTLLLDDWPDNAGALRYLADLLDRQAKHRQAAPLWDRAAAVQSDPAERDELELRAARSWLAAGEMQAAHEHANRLLERRPSSDEAWEIRLDAARALGANADVSDALDSMAAREIDERRCAGLWLEAARAAARAADPSRALDRARRAIAADPEKAAPRLFAHEMEYRMRGAGTPEEARQTIEDLTRIGEPLGTDDAAVRAFLLAEALDVVQGGGAGLRELEATRAVIGHHPVLALGLAERLAAQGQYAAAVGAYRAAVVGPLLDLRRPGAVALAGAEMAVHRGDAEDAAHFLDVAERYDDSRALASALRGRLAAQPATVDAASDVRLYDLEAAVETAKHPHERAKARLAHARGRLDHGDVAGAEPLLWEALAEGLIEAGDVLAPLLASSRDRTPELVRVRWQQVALEPGDLERLESLRAAALADDDRTHARAVEHVLRAFDSGAGPLPPPPLATQPEQPGILALLTRPSTDAVGEAFALLWEGAMQLFVRAAASYGITGVERIVAGPSSPVARLYEVALRVLGAPLIPLFASRVLPGAVMSNVALLAPASVILTGDVRQDTPELRYQLGRGISAALPQNVLRRALPIADGRTIIDAMRTAFGPPGLGRPVDSRAARLAEAFWQIIPARAQRRLQELLRAAAVADYEDLVEASLQSGRRVGMFLAGDFGTAARALLAETGHREAPTSPEGLRELCSTMPALADLLRLAVRTEYADARWHPVAPTTPPRTASSGRFTLL